MMTPRLLELLCDPNDGGDLLLHSFTGTRAQTRDGVLLNAQTGRWYPVQDGIPSLFIDALRPDDSEFLARFGLRLQALGLQALGCNLDDHQIAAPPDAHAQDFERIAGERRARDEQAEAYDHMLSLIALGWFEIPAYRRALEMGGDDSPAATRPLFEAGCGTGRLTGLFANYGVEVVAADMSRDSIQRNRVRHLGKTRAPVHYVHADLTHLPLKTQAFGRIAHCGVYEHIPTQTLRQQFLAHAQRVLHPQGKLLLSAYRYDGLTKRFEKEGEHAGGIPFFRFTPQELKAEIAPYFNIEHFQANLAIYMSMAVATPKSPHSEPQA